MREHNLRYCTICHCTSCYCTSCYSCTISAVFRMETGMVICTGKKYKSGCVLCWTAWTSNVALWRDTLCTGSRGSNSLGLCLSRHQAFQPRLLPLWAPRILKELAALPTYCLLICCYRSWVSALFFMPGGGAWSGSMRWQVFLSLLCTSKWP